MTVRLFLAILLLGNIGLAISAPEILGAEPEVRYRSPFKLGPETIFDFSNNVHYAGGDVGHPFETCGEPSEFECLYFDDFALSVPRKGAPNGTTWRIGKFAFVARGGGELRLNGRELSVTIIDTIVDGTPSGRANVRAVYDAELGIVAWAYLLWERSPITNEVNPYPTISDPLFADDIGLWPRKR